MSSRKMNEAELQRRMDIYFPATSGKQCHMQIRVHKTMQEALDSINICQTMGEVVLISKKKTTPKPTKQNQDIDAFWGKNMTAC